MQRSINFLCATRSTSNESEHKAMWAVFEAWKDYQPYWAEEARDYTDDSESF
jgi:hypothetical protein